MRLGLTRVKSVAIGIAEPAGTEVTEQEWSELGIDPAKAGDIRSQIMEVAKQAEELAVAV